MIRVWLRLCLWLTVGGLLPVCLIRAQPYADNGLQAYFEAQDCPAPCFMGIQPGVTPLYRADLILEGHEWVGHVERNMNTLVGEPATLRCTWSGRQPGFFANGAYGSVRSDNGVFVDELLIELKPSLGDIWLSLGPPQAYDIAPVTSGLLGDALGLITHYPNFAILGITNCPFYTSFWHSGVAIRIQRVPAFSDLPAPSHQPLPVELHNLDREWCRG